MKIGYDYSMEYDLGTVIDVLTIGVGIMGTLAISVVGMQYLMAGKNEVKVRKYKHHFFEIIIGIVLYALVVVIIRR